jgi:hypothetical protein
MPLADWLISGLEKVILHSCPLRKVILPAQESHLARSQLMSNRFYFAAISGRR